MVYVSVLCLEPSLQQLLFPAGTRRMIYKYCVFLYPDPCLLRPREMKGPDTACAVDYKSE